MFSWLIVDVCCCDETECLSELYLNYTNYITTLNYTELNITTKLYTSTMTYIHTICNTILISTRILHSPPIKSTLPHYIIIYIYHWGGFRTVVVYRWWSLFLWRRSLLRKLVNVLFKSTVKFRNMFYCTVTNVILCLLTWLLFSSCTVNVTFHELPTIFPGIHSCELCCKDLQAYT